MDLYPRSPIVRLRLPHGAGQGPRGPKIRYCARSSNPWELSGIAVLDFHTRNPQRTLAAFAGNDGKFEGTQLRDPGTASRPPGKVDIPALHPHSRPVSRKPQALLFIAPDVLTAV